jgi:hypothetical protein
MSCITFLTYEVAYRQVVGAASHEIVKPGNVMAYAQSQPLHSSWQMVVDDQGRRRLEMRWKTQ